MRSVETFLPSPIEPTPQRNNAPDSSVLPVVPLPLKIALVTLIAWHLARQLWVRRRARAAWREAGTASGGAPLLSDPGRWPVPPPDSEMRVDARENGEHLLLPAKRTGNEIFGAVLGAGAIGVALWIAVTAVLPPRDLPWPFVAFALGLFLALGVPVLFLESRVVRIERSSSGLRFVRRFGAFFHLGTRVPARTATDDAGFELDLENALGMTVGQERPFVVLRIHRSRGAPKRLLLSLGGGDAEWLSRALEGWRREPA